jgi:hypothetical protein
MSKPNIKSGFSQLQDVVTQNRANQEATAISEQIAKDSAPASGEVSAAELDDSTQAPVAQEVATPIPVVAQTPMPAPMPAVRAAVVSVEPVKTVVSARASMTPQKQNGIQVSVAAKAVVADTALPSDEFELELKRVLKDVPVAYQGEIVRVLAYVKDMNVTRPTNPKVGAGHQVSLYRAVQTLINRQEVHFTALFTALLKIIYQNRQGVFAPTAVARFVEEMALVGKDRKAFVSLMYLFCQVADPKGRALSLKQIDLERAIADGLSYEGQSRVVAYLKG